MPAQRDVYLTSCFRHGVDPNIPVACEFSSLSEWLPERGGYRFSSLNLGSQDLPPLIEALRVDRSFQSISFAENKLTDDDIVFLAESLTSQPQLTSLDVSSNCFASRGAQALLTLALKNPTIISISLSDNAIDWRTVTLILLQCLRNRRRSLESQKAALTLAQDPFDGHTDAHHQPLENISDTISASAPNPFATVQEPQQISNRGFDPIQTLWASSRAQLRDRDPYLTQLNHLSPALSATANPHRDGSTPSHITADHLTHVAHQSLDRLYEGPKDALSATKAQPDGRTPLGDMTQRPYDHISNPPCLPSSSPEGRSTLTGHGPSGFPTSPAGLDASPGRDVTPSFLATGGGTRSEPLLFRSPTHSRATAPTFPLLNDSKADPYYIPPSSPEGRSTLTSHGLFGRPTSAPPSEIRSSDSDSACARPSGPRDGVSCPAAGNPGQNASYRVKAGPATTPGSHRPQDANADAGSREHDGLLNVQQRTSDGPSGPPGLRPEAEPGPTVGAKVGAATSPTLRWWRADRREANGNATASARDSGPETGAGVVASSPTRQAQGPPSRHKIANAAPQALPSQEGAERSESGVPKGRPSRDEGAPSTDRGGLPHGVHAHTPRHRSARLTNSLQVTARAGAPTPAPTRSDARAQHPQQPLRSVKGLTGKPLQAEQLHLLQSQHSLPALQSLKGVIQENGRHSRGRARRQVDVGAAQWGDRGGGFAPVELVLDQKLTPESKKQERWSGSESDRAGRSSRSRSRSSDRPRILGDRDAWSPVWSATTFASLGPDLSDPLDLDASLARDPSLPSRCLWSPWAGALDGPQGQTWPEERSWNRREGPGSASNQSPDGSLSPIGRHAPDRHASRLIQGSDSEACSPHDRDRNGRENIASPYRRQSRSRSRTPRPTQILSEVERGCVDAVDGPCARGRSTSPSRPGRPANRSRSLSQSRSRSPRPTQILSGAEHGCVDAGDGPRARGRSVSPSRTRRPANRSRSLSQSQSRSRSPRPTQRPKQSWIGPSPARRPPSVEPYPIAVRGPSPPKRLASVEPHRISLVQDTTPIVAPSLMGIAAQDVTTTSAGLRLSPGGTSPQRQPVVHWHPTAHGSDPTPTPTPRPRDAARFNAAMDAVGPSLAAGGVRAPPHPSRQASVDPRPFSDARKQEDRPRPAAVSSNPVLGNGADDGADVRPHAVQSWSDSDPGPLRQGDGQEGTGTGVGGTRVGVGAELHRAPCTPGHQRGGRSQGPDGAAARHEEALERRHSWIRTRSASAVVYGKRATLARSESEPGTESMDVFSRHRPAGALESVCEGILENLCHPIVHIQVHEASS